MGVEGKASYSFAANDVTGKIWVGGKDLKIQDTVTSERDARAAEIGAKVAASGIELVGYYYDGKNVDSGIGTAINTSATAAANTFATNNTGNRDNSGGYVQATYVMPFKTKVGVSWGKNIIDKVGTEVADRERTASIIGAYHPLTKHLNLVAEYNHLKIDGGATSTVANFDGTEGKNKTMSLGAILFFQDSFLSRLML